MSTIPSTPARPPFLVSGNASIKHLNVRKEGPEDDKILAVDVKLEFKNIDRRLCDYFDDAAQAFLWRGETNALIVRNDFLAPLAYGNEISSATVVIGTDHFSGCDVKKFSILPRDGGVIWLTCSVALYPSSSDVSSLAKLVQEEVAVKIEGPPDLFAESPELKVDSAGNVGTANSSVADPLYQEALALVQMSGKASISMVQRSLKIGYNRAAQLLEDMGNAGVVSPMKVTGERMALGGETQA